VMLRWVNKKVPKKTRKWFYGRGILKVVQVVILRGNRKAKSGSMGTDVPFHYGTTFKKNESGRDFQRGQIWNDRSRKQKKNYGRHPHCARENRRAVTCCDTD